jgi:beta-lactamase class A
MIQARTRTGGIKMSKKNWASLLLAALMLLPSIMLSQEKAEDKTLRLAIGDAKLKNKVIPVPSGGIVSARTGKPVPFEKMIQELKDSRFVYVGESHDNAAMHDIQLKVIQALFTQDPGIAIGLEMLPAETQPTLDKWSQGLLSKDDLIREASWYVNWSLNFGYYEKIFDFARDTKIPVFGLNAPRDVITKIRIKGWEEGLSDEEKALVPRPALSNQEHRTLIRMIFESSEIPHAMKGEGLEKMFEGLYRAQSAWDEVMAVNSIKGTEREKKRMVVLAGSGHLLYNLGINRRVFERNQMPFSTIVAVELAPDERSLAVSGSLADFIWGIPEQERPIYPAVGLALKKVDGLDNLVIERKPIDGVALGADIEKGDVLLSVDGRTFSNINEMRTYLAGIPWDGEVEFRLLRNGEARELTVKFEFKPQTEIDEAGEKAPGMKMKAALAAAPASDRIDRLRRRIEDVAKRAGGEVGVAVRHLESGQSIELKAGDHFPMASVFKLPVLVEIMAQVKAGRFSLDDEVSVQKVDQHLGSGMLSSLTAPGIKLTVRNLVNLMMMVSDNSATDLLLAKVDAENVNKRLRGYGVEGISVNRSCQELIMDWMGVDYQKYKGLTLEQIEAESRKMPEQRPEARREARRKFIQDPRDQSTPAAMNLLLEKIHKKEILDPESCDLILSIMLQCQTGEGRIKGELPAGTPVAHKTGTIAGTFNDTGIITLPDSLGHVALTVFTKDSEDETEDVEKIIAGIGRLVYDYFVFTGDVPQSTTLH